MRSTERGRLFAALILGAALLPPVTAGARPLSASDWLSGDAAPAPPVSAWRPGDARPRDAGKRAVPKPANLQQMAVDVRVPPVGVTRLPPPDAGNAGTLPVRTTGLPRDLWTATTAEAAATALAAARPRLPATQSLLRTILLAQLDPPGGAGADPHGQFFLARVDRLMAMGAVDAANQLLDVAGPGDAQRFGRRFDALLLAGDEDRACSLATARPGAATDLSARLFCLARAGDWASAAAGLDAGAAIGLIEPARAARLAAFLDDAGTDTGAEVPAPEGGITPLDFRLMAAVGEPLATADLPPAYAWSDLGSDGGWKARLDAAERLARAAALPAARLREIYHEERPAASGGVWDRVAAIQALDTALDSGDRAAIAAALPRAVTAMGQAGLTAPLAAMVAPRLLPLQLDGEAGRLALYLGLYDAERLGPRVFAALPDAADPGDGWLLAVARRTDLPDSGMPADPLAPALATVLAPVMAPPATLPPDSAKGLVLLAAMADTDAGLDGDAARAARGIATLRALGREDTARAAALQLLLGPQLGLARP